MPYPGLPDWNERALELGVPAAMDTPTLIEWIQRQLETPEETLARFMDMDREHNEWHRTVGGIYACCINLGVTNPEYDRIVKRYGPHEWLLAPGRVWELPSDQ